MRLEANRFLSAPAFNPAVRETFGARTDHAPNAVHLSPRLGFTWVYGAADGNTARSAMSALGTRFQGPTGVLRGGIGEFRNLLPPTLFSEAALATGLPGGARRLVCLGPAVPTPDWAAYANDPAAVPEECEGSRSAPAFADAAPGVHLFNDSFTAPRSWRGNLAWNSRWKKLGFNVEGVYSLNLHQPGTVDLNFAGAPAFALPAGRNSCRGPWTQSLNARVALSSFLLRTRRANLAVTLGNPLGGLDQLLHGSRDLRGWGTSAMPDPSCTGSAGSTRRRSGSATR